MRGWGSNAALTVDAVALEPASGDCFDQADHPAGGTAAKRNEAERQEQQAHQTDDRHQGDRADQTAEAEDATQEMPGYRAAGEAHDGAPKLSRRVVLARCSRDFIAGTLRPRALATIGPL